MIREPGTMERRLCLGILMLIALSEATEQSRWSRQISSYTSDISDWVPLPGPIERSDVPQRNIKRQAIAQPRILSEPFPGFSRPTGFSPDFPARSFYQPNANRQLYLQSVPSAPQNFLNEQGFGQNLRLGLTQPNYPLSQGFVAPGFPFENAPPVHQRPQFNEQALKFESLPKPIMSLSPQAKPFVPQQAARPSKIEFPKFIDGYRAENLTTGFTFPNSKKTPQSLQKLKMDSFDKVPQLHEPSTISSAQKSKLEREEVQLLYVPVESLNRGEFSFKNQPNNQQVLGSDIFSTGIQKPVTFKQPQVTDFPRPSKLVESFSFGQDFFTNLNSPFRPQDQVPKFSTISSPFPTIITTTSKPKKLKPHQPPLAVFIGQDVKKGDKIKVADVLSSLKSARTIAVLDTVGPDNSPKVFIGPSSLTPPQNYVKFDLPYLSNIEHSDKKLKQLPFFVAPLSYNTPDGFAKIPFPSPHVGSVIVNAQIKENQQSTPSADIYPNSYTASPPSYSQPKQSAPQKPKFSYYSTLAPKTNAPATNLDANYYSFEPQTVTSIKPTLQESKPNVITGTSKPPSYFLGNAGEINNQDQQLVNGPSQGNNYDPTLIQANRDKKTERPAPSKPTTVPSTTKVPYSPKAPSTYSSQLLETHNPYSINQAFHFSTPLDYQTYFEEHKDAVTPGPGQSPTPQTPTPIDAFTGKQTYQTPSSPYLQSYTPEIHYGSEIQTPRFTDGKPEVSSQYSSSTSEVETPSPNSYKTTAIETDKDIPVQLSDTDVVQSTRSPNVYNQYSSDSGEYKDSGLDSSTATTTTTTTTTRRTPIRTRGRPHRYSTTKSESNESSTRSSTTRRPLRERRPLPSRSRYEPNKISAERTTKKQVESNDSTTKSPRSRTRGRVHYKTQDNADNSDSKKNTQGKADDLAYQRDVLHQNYPVTLMERMSSTADIEAITEPTEKLSSIRYSNSESSSLYDSERAYSAETSSTLLAKLPESQTEVPSYVPRLPATKTEENIYHSRSSPAQIDALPYSDNISDDKQEQYTYTSSRSTTPLPRTDRPSTSYIPDSVENDYASSVSGEIETTIRPDFEITKINNLQTANSYEVDSSEKATEESIQTTAVPARVRVRPGGIRHIQTSTTEPTTITNNVKSKQEFKRRPLQPVTYRPAFDRRRTTMRIEEIEADLKTKPVSTRPEVQEYRHPVYKPEPTTESVVSTGTSSTTKRGQFKRRRPQSSSSTSTTESTQERKKPTYEVRNRFRGRRPSDKTTENPDSQTEVTPTTTRNIPHRYSHRPKLTERFNRKPVATQEQETEVEDQDPNYSINSPKYVLPDGSSGEEEKWSPKIASDTFKPYNPNDIIENKKVATTEKRSGESDNAELDIITARNDYDDILISVTPATNRLNKKIPEIPPTLEALVEQSKSSTVGSQDGISTFESMLEEVMKSLEEQDEDEYTKNVMKHKGGEIGEIPPEKIISSGENYSQKSTDSFEEITTTEVNSRLEESTVSEVNYKF